MLHLQERRAGVTYSPSDHQRRIDKIQAAIRAESVPAAKPRLYKPAPARSPPSTDPLDHRLSEELECICRRLDQLGGVLAGNSLLVQRHAAELQTIDLINQVLGHISAIVSSEDKALAVEQVTLRELRSRLQRKPLSPL